MKIRKTVKHQQFKEYFRFEENYSALKYGFHWNKQFFNSFSLSVILILILCFLGIWTPLFWALAFALSGIIAFSYFRVQRIATGLGIYRSCPTFAREKNLIEIKYTIFNETAFKMDNVNFMEEFDGIQSGEFKVEINRTIPPRTQFEISKKLTLDGGMGVKTLPPFTVTLRDELSMFEFKITFQQTSEIEIYPYIEEIPVFKTSISPESIEYGFYEIAKKGDSNLFIGTRDYRHGDPVRSINWKLTKKSGKVIVNEYEKNTNSYVTLLLDLRLEEQSGTGALSTWEGVKDLALSITENEISKNNFIQVISSNLYIPFGSGQGQLSTIEKHFTYHELLSKHESNHLDHLQYLPEKSQLYFICPLVTSSEVIATFDLLLKLKIMGHRVIIFAIDVNDELQKHLTGTLRLSLLEIDRTTKERFAQYQKNFLNMEIPIIPIKINKTMPLSQQVANTSQEYLE